MIDLARRSGQIASLQPVLSVKVTSLISNLALMKINTPPRRKRRCPCYPRLCCRRLKDGGTQFEVMTRKQIELVAARVKLVITGRG